MVRDIADLEEQHERIQPWTQKNRPRKNEKNRQHPRAACHWRFGTRNKPHMPASSALLSSLSLSAQIRPRRSPPPLRQSSNASGSDQALVHIPKPSAEHINTDGGICRALGKDTDGVAGVVGAKHPEALADGLLCTKRITVYIRVFAAQAHQSQTHHPRTMAGCTLHEHITLSFRLQFPQMWFVLLDRLSSAAANQLTCLDSWHMRCSSKQGPTANAKGKPTHSAVRAVGRASLGRPRSRSQSKSL